MFKSRLVPNSLFSVFMAVKLPFSSTSALIAQAVGVADSGGYVFLEHPN
jgi:hypothetical protein